MNLFFLTFCCDITFFILCGMVLFRIKDILRAFIPFSFYVIMHDCKNITKGIGPFCISNILYLFHFYTHLWCLFTKDGWNISCATWHKIQESCKKWEHIFMIMWHPFFHFSFALRTFKFISMKSLMSYIKSIGACENKVYLFDNDK